MRDMELQDSNELFFRTFEGKIVNLFFPGSDLASSHLRMRIVFGFGCNR